MMNFLLSCGWTPDQVEARLVEWNSKNREPLREQYITGQMRYARQQGKKAMPPPSCNNPAYYKGMGVCKPDELCARIKNPLQYAKLKASILERQANAAAPKRVGKKEAIPESKKKN
jgi:DNA primase large subunit